MMSETATVRLPPGPQACLPWLARGVGPETANCYTKRPVTEDPRKMAGTLRNVWGLACEKCLAANFQGLPPFDLRAHARPQGFQKDAW